MVDCHIIWHIKNVCAKLDRCYVFLAYYEFNTISGQGKCFYGGYFIPSLKTEP